MFINLIINLIIYDSEIEKMLLSILSILGNVQSLPNIIVMS